MNPSEQSDTSRAETAKCLTCFQQLYEHEVADVYGLWLAYWHIAITRNVTGIS